MAEYRHNAAVVLGGILTTIGAGVILGWWTITATVVAAPGFWQPWLIAPAFVAVGGLVVIAGVLFDWWPGLARPRKREQPPALRPERKGFLNREKGRAIFHKKPKFGSGLDVGFDNSGEAEFDDGAEFD